MAGSRSGRNQKSQPELIKAGGRYERTDLVCQTDSNMEE